MTPRHRKALVTAAGAYGAHVTDWDDGSARVTSNDLDVTLHPTKTGRWVRCRWDERAAQYTSSDLPRLARFPGYDRSVSRTVDGLVAIGIRSYATPAAAFRSYVKAVTS